MTTTKIQWTDRVWNPVRGCSKVSPGCANCYAERMAARFSGPGQPYEGLVSGGKWTNTARFVPEMLTAPLSWRKPCRVFVSSMSDLFHGLVANEQIAAVFGVMAACPQHTFQILTKRPERMVAWFEWAKRKGSLLLDNIQSEAYRVVPELHHSASMAVARGKGREWPLPNVHIGVSVENQAAADERIPLLIQCPAAVRWVSCEPLLGAVNLDEMWGERRVYIGDSVSGYLDWEPLLDWVVCGGESGHNARPMHPYWARSLRDQCRDANVPFWFKQWGEFVSVYDRDVDDPDWQLCSQVRIENAPGQWLNLDGGILDGERYEMRPGDKW